MPSWAWKVARSSEDFQVGIAKPDCGELTLTAELQIALYTRVCDRGCT